MRGGERGWAGPLLGPELSSLLPQAHPSQAEMRSFIRPSTPPSLAYLRSTHGQSGLWGLWELSLRRGRPVGRQGSTETPDVGAGARRMSGVT